MQAYPSSNFSSGESYRSSLNATDEKKQRRVEQDIEEMMYGFGDAWPPHRDAVSLVTQLVADYIEEITAKALSVSELTGKLNSECFMYLVRKDRKKFNRLHQLLTANEVIKKAKVDDVLEFENAES